MNRGLYFDGTNNGYIDVSTLILNHSFSVHSWIHAKTLSGDMTIYSRDRDIFTPTTDKRQHLRLSLGGAAATNKLRAQIA
jgi:hypothetical protein